MHFKTIIAAGQEYAGCASTVLGQCHFRIVFKLQNLACIYRTVGNVVVYMREQ